MKSPFTSKGFFLSRVREKLGVLKICPFLDS